MAGTVAKEEEGAAAHTICASMQNLWQRIYCQATRKNVNGAADGGKARLRDKC